MSHEGFARKYRPQTFEEVVGQKEVGTILKQSIATERIHHAYLFFGSRGVGKTSMARILAKALNCAKGQSPEPCNVCENCLRIAKGEDVDVIEIDGASNRGIDEIREIKEGVKYRPTTSRYKIYIIDEVHMLTEAAFNALLKTLEEPPDYVKFIFATTEIHKIPQTILSRCQRFNFNKITIEDIIQHLQLIAQKENLNVACDVIKQIAYRTGGALRDSLVILDQLAGSVVPGSQIDGSLLDRIAGSASQYAQNIIDTILARNVLELFQNIRSFYESGGNVSDLFQQLTQQFRDILVQLIVPQSKQDFMEGSESYLTWIQEKSKVCTSEYIQLAIAQILEAQNLMQSLQRNMLLRTILETSLLKILHIDSMLSLKKMEQSLLNLETRITAKGKVILPATPMPASTTNTNTTAPIEQVTNQVHISQPIASTNVLPNTQLNSSVPYQTSDTSNVSSPQVKLEKSQLLEVPISSHSTPKAMQSSQVTSISTSTILPTKEALENSSNQGDHSPHPFPVNTNSSTLDTTLAISTKTTQIQPPEIRQLPKQNIQQIEPSTKQNTTADIPSNDEACWAVFSQAFVERYPQDVIMLKNMQYSISGNQCTITLLKKYGYNIMLHGKELGNMIQKAFGRLFNIQFHYIEEKNTPLVSKAIDLFGGSISDEYIPL